MSDAMIRTDGLTKHFGRGDKKVEAVNSISFEVGDGIHGFLGPNGAGKSTTIKMLVGALPITKGNAWIRGNKVGSVAAKSLIGYLPEHPQFYDKMSLREYLVYQGRLGGLSRGRALDNAEDLAHWLNLEDAFERNVSSFSAGMKQKAGLAQAMIHEPEILILDEPTANLDPVGRASVLDNIIMLADEMDITVFASSHVLGEIEKLAKTVSIISKGQIVLDDKISAIKDRIAGQHYILTTSDNESIRKLLEQKGLVGSAWFDDEGKLHMMAKDENRLKRELPIIIANEGMMLESFRRLEVTLETIFMETVARKDGKPGEGVVY
jgi:ABC-2 type transport system ATP-binding protein